MPSLIIDTSSQKGLLAVIDPNQIFKEKILPFGLRESAEIMSEIEDIFRQSLLDFKSLTSIIVGIGPGSYTGLRVGVAVAKSLSFALNKPLKGFCSLKGFIPSVDGFFLSVIDAKTKGLYVLKGKKEKNKVHYLSEPKLIAIEELQEELILVDTLVSPSFNKLKGKILSCYPELQVNFEEVAPNSRHIYAINTLLNVETNDLEILYLSGENYRKMAYMET